MRSDFTTFDMSAGSMAVMGQIKYDPTRPEGQELTADHSHHTPKLVSSQSSLSKYHIYARAVR
jgi:hypothetical protein